MEAASWTDAAAWGRLASVRRSLAWAALGEGHATAARYLGLNCARLLTEVLGDQDLPEPVRGSLMQATEILRSLDALPPDQRLIALNQAEAAIDTVLPRAQVGASAAVGQLRPLARLLVAADDAPRVDEPAARPAEPPKGPPPAPREAPREARSEAPREPRPPEVPETSRAPQGLAEVMGAPLSALGLPAEILAALDAAGLCVLADVLMNPPVSFDRPSVLDPSDPEIRGETGLIRGRIQTSCVRFRHGQRWTELGLRVDETTVTCRYSDGLPPRASSWRPGQEVGVVGRLEEEGERLLMLDGEPLGMDGRGSGLIPCYGVEGVSDVALRDLVAMALHRVMGGLKDPLSDELVARHRLLALDEALRDGHFPANASFRGRHRMAFEELLALQIGLSRRLGRGAGDRGFAHRILHSGVGNLMVQLGVTLDDEQELAFAEIRRDLLRPVPMVRVLEGDVGTRKGLVALLSAVIVAENRAQVAVVSHDAAAAERQFLFAEPLLRAIGVRALYVGDTVSHAGADAIRRGEATVVYGTPRIVTGEVEWRRLGLVVALEHSELGIMLTGHLDARGPRPDLLVVSAAPVPASLLLSAYGPFDVSTVRRKDGQPVAVNVYSSAEREAAYELVREAVGAGRPALVVFPTRDGRDLLSREDATRVAEALRRDFLPEARVVVFSAEMTREERARVFDDLQHRRVDVLVSTTPIEDGPPVPTCSVVVVEQADHFDLARLHRLRGYASFGRRSGQCLLVLSDAPSPEGERRARRLATEGARMEFADEDIGAPGGLRVTAAAAAIEGPVTQWAEFPRDRGLLLEARAEAMSLLREDSALRTHGGLRRLIQERWPELLGEAPVGQSSADAGRNRRRKRRRRRR